LIGEIGGLDFLEEPPNQGADDACGEAFGGAVNGGDPFEMNGGIRVVFNDLKVGLIDDDLAPPAFGFAVDDETLAGGDEFFDPVKVEPTDDELAGERVAFFFDECGFEHPHPAAHSFEGGGLNEAADADGNVGVAVGKAIEAGAVFPAAGEVEEQIAGGKDASALELPDTLGPDPRDIFER